MTAVVVAERPSTRSAAVTATEPSWWETAFVGGVFLLSANAFVPLVFNPGIGAPATVTTAPAPLNDPLSQPTWALLSLFILAAVVRWARPIGAVLLRNPGIVAVCYIAATSVLWSSAPTTTLQDAVQLCFTTLFGVYIGIRFGIRRLVALLGWVTLLIAVASILFALGIPKYGVDPSHDGAWRGVFSTKNELGRMMSFAGVVWTIRFLERDIAPRTALTALAIVLTAGIGSGSRTALGVTALMAGVLFLARLLSKPGAGWVPVKGAVVTGALAAALVVVTNLRFLLAVVGSDYHLTGRTSIWAAVVDAIGRHPWFGYGFDAFWRGIAGPSLAVWRQAQTNPPHSHNGFLDLLLNLGVVGMLAFVVAYLVALNRAVRWLSRGAAGARLFPFAFLAFLVLYNVTESSLVDRRSLPWIVFAAVASAVTRPRRDDTAPAAERS